MRIQRLCRFQLKNRFNPDLIVKFIGLIVKKSDWTVWSESMSTLPEKITLSNNEFTINDLVAVARFHISLDISQDVKRRINQGRQLVEQFVREEKVVYGITTGVGDNSTIRISTTDSKDLQRNLIMSHACGVGNPLEKEKVRAIMVMMVQNFSQGYSGIRLETVDMLIRLLNHNITPIVPREGSLGYLNHQAHISLVLLGMGEAEVDGESVTGAEALRRSELEPIELFEKEGLSLINGTVDMTGIGALTVYDAENALKSADVISMISFEALKGTYYAFDPRISQLKRHPGQSKTIENIHRLIKNSGIAETFKALRTQDALSLRSIPQVHGACKGAVRYAKEVIEIEMNSATDNPLVFYDDQGEGAVISSSNCHGEEVALVLDFLAIAMSELANMSERRIYRLVTSHHSELPPFLVSKSGLNSGYMIPQYVAASLVSDNKVFSHPASVDSITTSGGQEDHVSMGTSAALKAAKVVSNSEKVIGIEWMCSCQGIDFLNPLSQGDGTKVAHDLFRKHVPHLDNDRILSYDMKVAEQLIHSGELVKVVEDKIGRLHV
jgi:histidine ammonia-lyase